MEAPAVPQLLADSALVVIQNQLLAGRKSGTAPPISVLLKHRKFDDGFDGLVKRLGVPRRWLEDFESGWCGSKPQDIASLPVYRSAYNAGRRLARKYA
jgi:hypothetical protein